VPYATLQQLKDQLHITSAVTDATLELHLGAAIDIVESVCGYADAVTVTEDFGLGRIVLASLPVISITSITPLGGTALDLSGVSVTPTGVVSDFYGVHHYAWRGHNTIVYVAGRGGVFPFALTLATLLIAAHTFRTTQRGPSGARMPGGDTDDMIMMGSGYAVPTQAWEFMRPFAELVIA
jgi:hypothetical protein